MQSQILKLKVLLLTLISAVDDDREQYHQILEIFRQSSCDQVDFWRSVNSVFTTLQRDLSRNWTSPLDRLKQILVSDYCSLTNIATTSLNPQQNQELLNEILRPEVFESFVDQIHKFVSWILAASTPSPETIKSRHLVIHRLRKVLFKASLTKTFSIDEQFVLFDDNCIQMVAVLLPRDQESWYMKANEALCTCAMSEDQQGIPIVVRDIGFYEGNLAGVRAVVNDFEVVFTANQISPLYRQLLFQKVNRLFGKSDLFHRSVLLILIWWRRESFRYLYEKCSTFSNLHILLMTMFIFHRFGRTISEPFHALVHFLHFFLAFDWKRYALTMFGPVDISTVGQNQGVVGESGMIPRKLVEGIRKRMPVVQESTQEQESQTGEVDDSKKRTFAIPSKIFGSYDFQPSTMVILDPLLPGCNTSVTISESSYQSIQLILQKGYAALIQTYLLSKQTPEKCLDNMSTFFGRTVDILAAHNFTYPETPVNSTLISPFSDHDQAIMHVEFVFNSIISLDLLPQLIAEIIDARGSIPIGEVGKLLAEITGNENLPTILKNKFRGLKRIIESYPDLVILGTEHPFNPLVHLSETYNLRENEQFNFPLHDTVPELAIRPTRTVAHASKDRSLKVTRAPSGNTAAPLSTNVKNPVVPSINHRQPHSPTYQHLYHLPLSYGQQMSSFMPLQPAFSPHPSEGYPSPIYMGASRSSLGNIGYHNVYYHPYPYSMVSTQNHDIAPPLPSPTNSSTSSTPSSRNKRS